MTANTAVKIKDMRRDAVNASLYRLDPPLDGNRYAIASSTTVKNIDECFLFPATETGKISSWTEFAWNHGTLSHHDAFAVVGYTIKEEN